MKLIAGEHEKTNAGDRILEHMSQPLPNNNRPPSKDNIQELIHGKITPRVRQWAIDRFEGCKPVGQISQNYHQMAPCNADCLIKFLTDPDVVQSLKDLAIYAEVASWIAGGDRCCNAGLPAKLKISFDCKDCL